MKDTSFTTIVLSSTDSYFEDLSSVCNFLSVHAIEHSQSKLKPLK